MSCAAIILCVATERVFIVVSLYFVIDSVRKLLDTSAYTVASAQATSLCPFQESLWLLFQPSLYLVSLGLIFFFLLGSPCVDRRGENRLTPGQNYRRVVVIPPSAFSPMFLLSQQRCAEMRFREGDESF
jgi:hypothetical protein